jgi:hypothetical protein
VVDPIGVGRTVVAFGRGTVQGVQGHLSGVTPLFTAFLSVFSTATVWHQVGHDLRREE